MDDAGFDERTDADSWDPRFDPPVPKPPKPDGLCTNWKCPVRDQCCVVWATDCLSYRKPVN